MAGCLFPGAAVAHSRLSLKLEGSRAFAQLLVLPGGLASLACRRITAASASGVTWLLLWSVSVVSVSLLLLGGHQPRWIRGLPARP